MPMDVPTSILPQEPATTRQLPSLVGVDLWDVLEDDAGMILGAMWMALVIDGDVHIDGSVKSSGIASHLVAEHPDLDRWHTIVVLGDLTVDGELVVQQYNDLLVRGSVSARGVTGGSANLVAGGPIRVSGAISWRESEEGGVLWAPEVHATLFFRDPYTDIEPNGSFDLVSRHDEARMEAFVAALRDLGELQLDDFDTTDIRIALGNVVAAGRLDELMQSFAEHRPPRSTAPKPGS